MLLDQERSSTFLLPRSPARPEPCCKLSSFFRRCMASCMVCNCAAKDTNDVCSFFTVAVSSAGVKMNVLEREAKCCSSSSICSLYSFICWLNFSTSFWKYTVGAVFSYCSDIGVSLVWWAISAFFRSSEVSLLSRSTATAFRWMPFSTVESSCCRAAVSSCTLAMVCEGTRKISSRTSFWVVTYFLKASTVSTMAAGKLSSFTVLSAFPATEPGTDEFGSRSTPPRPMVVVLVAVDGTAVVGAAWLKLSEGVELRPPSDRPVDVVLVWPKPATPGTAAAVNGVLPNRPAVVVVAAVVGAPVVEAVVAAGVAPKPTAVGSTLLEVTAAVMCVDEGVVLPAKDGAAAVEAGTVMDAVVVLVVSVAGVCPGTDDAVNVGMPMLGAVTVAVAVGVAAPKLMVADGVVLNAGAEVDAGTPN